MRIKVFDLYENSNDCDLRVCGFNNYKRIKYSNELSGKTQYLKDYAELTKKNSDALLVAFDTDNYGILRQSVGVFENGKLLGISDMATCIDDFSYMPSGNGKLYELSCGKIGVVIGDDIYSFELFKAFSLVGADAIIVFEKNPIKEIDRILIRAFSFLSGVPCLLISLNATYASNCDGEKITADENGIYNLTSYAEYRLKTTKIKLTK